MNPRRTAPHPHGLWAGLFENVPAILLDTRIHDLEHLKPAPERETLRSKHEHMLHTTQLKRLKW